MGDARDLQRALQALLNDRARGPLAGRRPLLPVLGGVGIGSALPPALLPLLRAYMDHGLLQADSVGESERATILAYEALAEYLSTVGVDDLSVVCGVEFPNDFGAAASGEYSSSVWGTAGNGSDAATNPNILPHMHSGLGVLWAQGMVGAGRKMAELIGEVEYAPTSQTVVRSPSGDYWLISSPDSSDITATKLVQNSDLVCAEAQLRTGEVSGIFGDLLQAVVLGNLALTDPPETVTVMAWDDLASHFNAPSGYYWAAAPVDRWGWGWQWSQQRAGAPDELAPSAARVLLGVLQGYASPISKRCYCRDLLLSLLWDTAGIPSAIVSAEDTVFCWPAKLMQLVGCSGYVYPDPIVTSSLCYDVAALDAANIFDPGPLAVWWNADGARTYVRWNGMSDWATFPHTGGDMALRGYGSVTGVANYGESGGIGSIWVGTNEFRPQLQADSTRVDVAYTAAQEQVFETFCTWGEPNPEDPIWGIPIEHVELESRVETATVAFSVNATAMLRSHIKAFVIFGRPRMVWVVEREMIRAWSGSTSDAFGPTGGFNGNSQYFDVPCNPGAGIYEMNNDGNAYGYLYPGIDKALQPAVAPTATLIAGDASHSFGPVPVSVAINGAGDLVSVGVTGDVLASHRGQVVTAVDGVAMVPAGIPAGIVAGPSGFVWLGGA